MVLSFFISHLIVIRHLNVIQMTTQNTSYTEAQIIMNMLKILIELNYFLVLAGKIFDNMVKLPHNL